MDENLLYIALALFALLMLIVAFILRRMTVDDIFRDDAPTAFSDGVFSSKTRDVLPSAPKNTLSSPLGRASSKPMGGADASQPIFELNGKSINNIAKVLGAIGVIMLFAPLPNIFNSIGIWLAIIASLVARVTNPASNKKSAQSNRAGATKIPMMDLLRKLAGKPEYREAMQILSVDMAKKDLDTDLKRQERAIRYLQSKGVSAEEAIRNIRIMADYLKTQQNTG